MFLAYFLWLVAGILIGTFFYTLYLHSLGLIAGRQSHAFTRENVIISFFAVTQVMAMLSGFLLIAWRIRHPGNFLQLIFFIITQFISWCIIFPLSAHFETRYISSNPSIFEQESIPLSTGYFRESEGKVYYFLNEENTSSLKIDTRDEGNAEILKEDWSGYAELSREALPYQDVLIKDSFKAKYSSYSFFGTLIQSGKRELTKGWTYWLGFLSMALVLTSIYGMTGYTAWRITNYSICSVLYGVILFCNGYFWSPAMRDFRNLNFLQTGPFGYFKTWFSSPFLLFCNLVLALILSVTGLIAFIIKKKRGR